MAENMNPILVAMLFRLRIRVLPVVTLYLWWVLNGPEVNQHSINEMQTSTTSTSPRMGKSATPRRQLWWKNSNHAFLARLLLSRGSFLSTECCIGFARPIWNMVVRSINVYQNTLKDDRKCIIITKLINSDTLRLLDTYDAKHMEIRPPLQVLLNDSVTRPSLKNLYDCLKFVWSLLTIWKWSLVAMLKFKLAKFTFFMF